MVLVEASFWSAFPGLLVLCVGCLLPMGLAFTVSTQLLWPLPEIQTASSFLASASALEILLAYPLLALALVLFYVGVNSVAVSVVFRGFENANNNQVGEGVFRLEELVWPFSAGSKRISPVALWKEEVADAESLNKPLRRCGRCCRRSG
jgi:hypothetical protein